MTERPLDEHAVAQLARRLLDEHGLLAAGWTFGWDRAVRRAGACHFATKRITLSRPIFRLPENAADIEPTIRHEIAHALAGPGAGHGPRWRSHARRLGIPAERCGTFSVPPGQVFGRCGCETPHTRVKLPRRGYQYSCRRCGAEIRWYRRTTRPFVH